MSEVTTKSDMLAVCKHEDCDRVIDMSPQKTLPGGKRPAPKQVRGMCMKHYMEFWRSKSMIHEYVCANPKCRKPFKTNDVKRNCCSTPCASVVGCLYRSKYRALGRFCKRTGCETPIPDESRSRYCSSKCECTVKQEQEQASEARKAIRSPLKYAIKNKDYDLILTLIRKNIKVDANGCWIWQKRLNETGYAQVNYRIPGVEQTGFLVHRLALEAKHSKELGTQTAHHKCAVRSCVNPEHLQPVTHRENVAEMFSRKAITDENNQLRKALRKFDPDHPLLTSIIGVA